jgi:hypothetical protein
MTRPLIHFLAVSLVIGFRDRKLNSSENFCAVGMRLNLFTKPDRRAMENLSNIFALVFTIALFLDSLYKFQLHDYALFIEYKGLFFVTHPVTIATLKLLFTA